MTLNNSINANASTPLSPLNGGSGSSSPTAHGILVAEGAGAFNPIVLTNGQLLIGSTGIDPVATGLTAGSGISIAPTAGAITISSTVVPGTSYAAISGTSQSAVAYFRYAANNVALTTVTLPASPVAGDLVAVRASGAGGFSVVAGSVTQVIHMGNVASSAGGSIASSLQWDSVDLECEVAGASAVWQVLASQGNLTLA